MYYVKPLIAEDIHYVASIMSEISNITALHSTHHSLLEWKCIFDKNVCDADEENFLICSDNDVCAWLKLNGLQNTDTAWISMLVVADKYKHKGVGKFAVEFTFEYLHSKGFNQIGVQTTKDNVAAINLYKKCGFNIVELKKFKTENGTKINSYIMLKTLNSKKYSLVLPDETHEEVYIQMMDRWESVENDIQPQLLRRYSDSQGKNVEYSKWLEWCEDDRTTGSMLSTGVPCTLYFLVDDTGEIFGAIEINHKNTHRGHLHAGIAPWHRDKGFGTIMLKLALDKCKASGFLSVEIVTQKSNYGAIKTILNNGGVLKETFFENNNCFLRFAVELTSAKSNISDFTFTTITKDNINQYKKLRKIFAEYKIQTLRNHGEAPGNKKMFYILFDGIVSSASESDTDYFVVMQSGKEVIGFASISTAASDVIDIPYNYGTVNDFYVSPKHRRKGYGRILNSCIEKIFIDSGTNTVLLYPDPVHGIPFWKAMAYYDTGINQGWGHYLVYCKHLMLDIHTAETDKAISELVKSTDLISINPYNKPQLKEVYGVWKEYCKEVNQKPRKKDVKNMAWNARKNRAVSFKALYYQGKVIGFTYKADNEINYVLSEYRTGEKYEQFKLDFCYSCRYL